MVSMTTGGTIQHTAVASAGPPRALRVIIFLLVLTWTAAGCGYSANELELATAARAKETCSCLFVARMVQEKCTTITATDPPLTTVQVDLPNKIVEAQALLMWSARARFVNERAGCVLE
jgi:hypothetical protein